MLRIGYGDIFRRGRLRLVAHPALLPGSEHEPASNQIEADRDNDPDIEQDHHPLFRSQENPLERCCQCAASLSASPET